MATKDIIRNLCACKMAGELTCEEDVKQVLVRPLIEGWGYQYGIGPGKYKAEFSVGQVGSKPNHSACDYRIETTGGVVVFEAKSIVESLDNPKHVAELGSYIKILDAVMGIMCNGIEIRFYMVNDNHDMETTPFRTITLENITQEDLKFLELMKAPGASLEKFRSEYGKATQAAKQETQVTAVAEWFENRARTITEDDEKTIVKTVLEPGRQIVTATALETYRTIIQAGMKRYQAESIARCRKTAEEEAAKYQNREETPETLAYGIVLGITADIVGSTPVKMFDFASGELAKICLNGQKSGQPILWVVGKVENNTYCFKGIAFPKENGDQGELVPFDSTTDILTLRDRIREETEISLRGPRFKVAQPAPTNEPTEQDVVSDAI